MAVGIGLDHRQNPRFRAEAVTNLLEIMAQGDEIDFDVGGATAMHDGNLGGKMKEVF